MKKVVLAGVFLASLALAAEAQVSFEYERRTRNSELRITYGDPWAYGPGITGPWGGGTFAFGVRHSWPSYAWGGAPVYGYSPGPAYIDSRFLPSPFPRYYRPYTMMDHSMAPPLPAARGVADRTHEHAALRRLEEGRRKFKAADYRGSRDEFREALIADDANGAARAWFALSLALLADARNADKALRGAADRVPFEKIDLKDAFKDEKERVRAMAVLGKLTGDGALTAAYGLSLAGEGAKLEKLAEKDPAAKKLLAK